MPDCIQCDYFNAKLIKCNGGNISPLRNCVNAFLTKTSNLIEAEFNILEIGCGNKKFIFDKVTKNNANWYGIDPKINSIATHNCSVKDTPFKGDFFEVVYASQTIEHWYEYGVSFNDGMKEIHRVLKPNGKLIIDFPIHLHGHYIFMLGIRNQIKNIFYNDSWIINDDYTWRKNNYPLSPYYTWNGINRKNLLEYIMQMILKKYNYSSYIRTLIITKNNCKYKNIKLVTDHKMQVLMFTIYLFIEKIYLKIISTINKIIY